MTEKNNGEKTDQGRSEAAAGMDQGAEYASGVARVMEGLTQTARVSSAFGEPRTFGDRTIIPVARVASGGGFGMGSGQAPAPEGAATTEAGGAGGGGGAGGMASPVAVVVITPDDVEVKPVMDLTQISLAALASGAFILFWIMRLLRGVRAGEQLEKTGKELSLGKMRKMLKF